MELSLYLDYTIHCSPLTLAPPCFARLQSAAQGAQSARASRAKLPHGKAVRKQPCEARLSAQARKRAKRAKRTLKGELVSVYKIELIEREAALLRKAARFAREAAARQGRATAELSLAR